MLLAGLGAAPMVWNLQSNAIVLALLAFGAATVVRQRWWTAAALFTLPVFIKLWPAAIAMLFAACWPRQLIGRLAAITAILLAVPFLTASPEQVIATYQDWGRSLGQDQAARRPAYRDALTIWAVTGLPADPTAFRVVGLGAAAGAALVCWFSLRRASDPRQAVLVALGLGVCWELLFGPGSEQNTYGVVLPLVGWAALFTRDRRYERYWVAATFTAMALLSCGDVESGLGKLFPGIRAVLPATAASFAVWLTWFGLRGEALAAVGGPAGDSLRSDSPENADAAAKILHFRITHHDNRLSDNTPSPSLDPAARD